MKRRSLPPLVFLSLFAAACGPEPQALTPVPTAKPSAPPTAAASASSTAPAAKTETLAADTPMKTASGATFTAPKAWHVTDMGGYLRLEEPEKDLQISLVEIDGTDVSKAIADSWQKIEPGFARKAEKSLKPPARDGWDEIQQNEYEVLSAEARGTLAIARRKDNKVFVALIDGKAAALDRRASEMMIVLQSFRAPGVVEVSWKDKTPLALDGDRLKAFEAFIEEARTKLGVPGIAVAVVQGGKVVLEKGYGARELGKKDATTPNTLFMIGSITKSFTSLLMATAIDAGKMTWDTPVTTILPTFAVGDAETSKKMLMRHTVCACTGLPRQDLEFLFEWKGSTPASRISALAGIKPTTGFGEVFQYSNLLVAAGGYIAAQSFGKAKDLGAAYAKELKGHVLDPLGMKATTLSIKQAAKGEHASPHGLDYKMDTVALPLSLEEGVESVGPAGGLWSSVHDMSQYLLLELGKGKMPGGKQVVSQEALLKRREPQVKLGEKGAYGLGIAVNDSHSVQFVGHNGATLGFTSDLFFAPEKDFGMVVLSNARTGGALNLVVRRKLLSILFEGKDEVSGLIDFTLKARKDEATKATSEIQTKVDAAFAASAKGTYEHAGLGKVTVSIDKEVVTIDVGEWKSKAGQKTESDGTKKLVLLDPPLPTLEFLVKPEGDKVSLIIEAPQQQYVLKPVSK